MKGANIARITLLVLFILFVGLYLVGNSNYYDYEAASKTRLTKEQIKQFEEDIKAGKEIDTTKYQKLGEKNYENPISDATLNISKTISKSFDKALNYIFGKINSVMEEK